MSSQENLTSTFLDQCLMTMLKTTTFIPDVNILVCIKSLCDILLGKDNSFWMNFDI